MAIYGYSRVSSTSQDTDAQSERLTLAGCTLVREEKVSGTSRAGRTELDTLLAFLRAGDTLMVTKVDRLARSVGDLQYIVRTIKERGAKLQVLDQPIDTGTPAGKCFLDMLGVFAEFETNLRRERQMEGIARARARGVYKGRRPAINPEVVAELAAAGLGPTAIAKRLGIARASVYRTLQKNTK